MKLATWHHRLPRCIRTYCSFAWINPFNGALCIRQTRTRTPTLCIRRTLSVDVTIGTPMVIFAVLLSFDCFWRLVHCTNWYTVPTVKNSQNHSCTNRHRSTKTVPTVYQSSKQSKTVKRQSKQQKWPLSAEYTKSMSAEYTKPLMGTLKPQSNGPLQQYGDWYTGRWWVGCYIWYSEEGPGRAATPPSPPSLYQM